MFSLELRNLTPPPPGISSSLTDASYLFSALNMDEIEKIDDEFYNSKQIYRECNDCKKLLKLCDDIFKQKVRAIACLSEVFSLLQQEIHRNLISSIEKNDKNQSENTGANKKITNMTSDIKKKNEELQELLYENRELNINRIYTQRLLNQMQQDIEVKANNIKKLEKLVENNNNQTDLCIKCKEKDHELRIKTENAKELNDQLEGLAIKLAESIKIISDKSYDLQKISSIQEVLTSMPEINGRELRISIHKKICEIETDFIELSANQENFEIIKMKYLQLPYLLKPIFDLTKQYEKSLMEFNKILYT